MGRRLALLIRRVEVLEGARANGTRWHAWRAPHAGGYRDAWRSRCLHFLALGVAARDATNEQAAEPYLSNSPWLAALVCDNAEYEQQRAKAALADPFR